MLAFKMHYVGIMKVMTSGKLSTIKSLESQTLAFMLSPNLIKVFVKYNASINNKVITRCKLQRLFWLVWSSISWTIKLYVKFKGFMVSIAILVIGFSLVTK